MIRLAGSGLFLVGAAALAWAVAVGHLDPLAIAPRPQDEEYQHQQAILGARSLEGISVQRLALADGAPVWSASGVSFERSGPGFAAREPRVLVYSKGGGATRL
ncbi:MAG: hypothetical protein ACAI25_17630, partial [Planctomycetota bacterium]